MLPVRQVVSGPTLYTYVWNNPTNDTDPTGFSKISDQMHDAQGWSTVYCATCNSMADMFGSIMDTLESGGKVIFTGKPGDSVFAGLAPGFSYAGNYSVYIPGASITGDGSNGTDVGGYRQPSMTAKQFYETATAQVGPMIPPVILPSPAPIGGDPYMGSSSGETQNQRLARKLTKLLKDDEEEQTIYVTYTRVNPKTKQIYSGRTSGIGTPQFLVERRGLQQGHLNSEGFLPPVGDKWSTNKNAVRGREQQLIDHYGGAQSVGGTSRNKINGVSDWNPLRGSYISTSIFEFGELEDHSPERFRFGP